jgi:hypothetical protein
LSVKTDTTQNLQHIRAVASAMFPWMPGHVYLPARNSGLGAGFASPGSFPFFINTVLAAGWLKRTF